MAETHLKLIDSGVDLEMDSTSEPRSAPSLPLPVQQLLEQTQQFFSEKLPLCFEQVDDTFFDLADRAENNAEQAVYFDAMRVIRIGRKDIEGRFAESINEAFARLTEKSQQADDQNASLESLVPMLDSPADPLEVLDNETLEETIATEAMVTKVAGRSKDVLRYLVARIDFMVPVTVTAHNNPLGPEVICHGFRESLTDLDIGVRSKLVFFKLFDRHVVEAMNDWLNIANDGLREKGILPDLERQQRAKELARKASRLRSLSSRKKTASGASGGANFDAGSTVNGASSQGGVAVNGESSESSQLISQIQNILSGADYDLSNPGVNNVTSPAGSGGGGTGLPLVALDELLDVVSGLEGQWQDEPADATTLLDTIQSQLQKDGVGTLRGRDHSVVHVLDQMFGAIRQQPSLSTNNGFAQQIRKLEMPILRIALRDGSFFDEAQHPARQLLNQISDVAIGYTDDVDIQSDPLGKAVTKVVDMLSKTRQVDNNVLTELLLEFIGLVEKERRRVLMMEQRLVEEVAASERVNNAHRQVKALLNNRMKGRRLPRILVIFAQEAWCRVLFMAHLKYGANSEQWKSAVKLIDQLLVLFLKGKYSPKKAAPVIDSACQRLTDISYDPHKLARLKKSLEKFFSQAQTQLQKASDEKTISSTGVTRKSVSNATVIAANTAGTQNHEEEIKASEKANPGPHWELVSVDQLQTDLPGNSDETEVDHQKVGEDYLNLADKLGRGAWVDFVDQDSAAKRCKVAGIISPPGKYIFVNRLGNKVAEISRYDIAKNIRDKKLVVLDNGQMFDKALQSVIQDIRENRQTA